MSGHCAGWCATCAQSISRLRYRHPALLQLMHSSECCLATIRRACCPLTRLLRCLRSTHASTVAPQRPAVYIMQAVWHGLLPCSCRAWAPESRWCSDHVERLPAGECQLSSWQPVARAPCAVEASWRPVQVLPTFWLRGCHWQSMNALLVRVAICSFARLALAFAQQHDGRHLSASHPVAGRAGAPAGAKWARYTEPSQLFTVPSCAGTAGRKLHSEESFSF